MATPTLTPVEGSRSVAAIGYDQGTIYVQFHGGKVYSYPDQPPDKWEALLRAHSKGHFVFHYLTRGLEPTDAAAAPAAPTSLQSLTDEAGKCCHQVFTKAPPLPDAKLWECPKCGQEYRVLEVGAIRRWEAHAWTMRF